MYKVALKSFRFVERVFRLHLTPVHYYSPIPDTTDLDESVYGYEFSMAGVEMDEAGQLDWLESKGRLFADEFMPAENTGLSLVDSSVLYAQLRERKPKIMVEIGSGESTRISLEALKRNRSEGNPCEFYAVEPYPRQFLRDIDLDWFHLIEEKIEDVDVEFLGRADVLFIDSSHVSRIGGDVNYEILEIVPRLKKGALVHWHDIMIPGNYWRDWTLEGNKFWNESYMLHAFLMFNSAYRIRWASRFMQERRPDELREAFPYASTSHRNTSFWVERIG